MIVELIGCTGVGKTTLRRDLASRRIVDDARSRGMLELVMPDVMLRHVSNETALNLAQEARVLPLVARSLHRRREFFAFARHDLARHAPTALHRLNRLRGVARRVGMYDLARTRAAHDVVVFDEGVVLLAYLFAIDGRPVSDADLERFATLVPLPDAIVNVRAPLDVLVTRARARTDRTRQVGHKSACDLERLLRTTDEIFQRLVTIDRLRDRVVTWDGSGALHELEDELRDHLEMRSRQLSHDLHAIDPQQG